MKRSLIQVFSDIAVARNLTKILNFMDCYITIFRFSYINNTAPVFDDAKADAAVIFEGLYSLFRRT